MAYSLESSLKSYPPALSSDGFKLSLVGKQITTIGKLPPSIARNIKVLYISNNSLKSLNGIDQFSQLKSISCANNNIKFLGDLKYLSACHCLEKVSFLGNIVTAMPYYREYIISICPNIISIDSMNVLWKEKIDSKSSSTKAQLYYDQLRLNDLRNCILRHIQKLVTCHEELKTTVFGRFR